MHPQRRLPWLEAEEARRAAAALGERQADVVSRRQLAAARVPRWIPRAELAAHRWQAAHEQVLVMHNGPMSTEQRRWVAVLGTSPRAALGGVTALQAAGATGLNDAIIHVITPRGSQPRPVPGVVCHESRRFREADVVSAGIRRTRPAVAAVHAALWAATDRQAALFMILCVQQRLARVADVAAGVAAVRRHSRRGLLHRLLLDLAGGVQSLGELDLAADFRRRGLPEPDRQQIRRRPSGTEYLDCRLTPYALVLEIDGVGHEAPEQKLADLLRDISTAADGDTTIRIPLLLYRLDAERVLDRLEALLRARGWQQRAA